MDPATLLALRSPAGVPSHPVIFIILGVLTWALHIMAVHVTLAGSLFSLLGLNKQGPNAHHWQRLAPMLLNHAKIGVSIAIVVGVAPLLFVQVIYDPFWYVSNVLSARWALGFIGLLLVGYWALWLHYSGVEKSQPGRTGTAWGWISLAILLVVGFIMHVLTSQMLEPDSWREWYAPGGVIDASGAHIHAYHPARFAFFILLALPMAAAWLLACRQYLAGNPDQDASYLEFLAGLAGKVGMVGGLLALGALAAWMVTLPGDMAGFALSPWTLLAAVATLMLAVLAKTKLNGYLILTWGLVTALAAGILREAYRYGVLEGLHGYDFMNYKIVMDWYSTILFFATFAIVGGVALAFMFTLSWQAGRSKGVYQASPLVARLGTLSIVVSVLWMVQYFVFGALTLAG